MHIYTYTHGYIDDHIELFFICIFLMTASKPPNQVSFVQLLRTISHGGSNKICQLEGQESPKDHHKNRGVGGWHLWSLN